jgi:SAM-dependent methyltransferase
VDFYDRLAPVYHLIFADWDASIARQAEALGGFIEARWPEARTVLDLACGIGTQALGLAARGYEVTASDISAGAVARAGEEAARRGVSLALSVADMRRAHEHHARSFDVVLACDNAVPHLDSEAELTAAFAQMFACTRPGGACILSVRDYEQLLAEHDHARPQLHLYGVRELEDGRRLIPFQVWTFDDPSSLAPGEVPGYELALYLLEDDGGDRCEAQVVRTRYRAWGIARLCELLRGAGFVEVERVDGVFYQPLIVAVRAP